MNKLVVMLRKLPSISMDDFKYRYEKEHLPLAGKYIGHLFSDFQRIYVSDLPRLWNEDGTAQNDGELCEYDVISIYTLKDEEAENELIRILSRPEITKELIEHEKTFLDRAAAREGFCEAFSGMGMCEN